MIKRRTVLGEVGRYLALGGGILLFFSLFARWGFIESGNAFETYERDQVYLLIIALAVVGLTIADALARWDGFIPIAGGLGALAFGGPFFIRLEAHFSHTPVGWFLALIASACIAAGGLIAMLDTIQRLNPADRSEPRPAQGPPSQVPAGWYPDPWGQANQRYWSGDTWTGSTQT